MKRKALIIGSPDAKIPGVNVDMENYRYYLKSAAGGAWYDSEITTLKLPSRTELDASLEILKQADYSFLVFAGHGGYSTLSRTTVLELNKTTSIDVDDLKIGAPRRTIVIDACRVLVPDSLQERMMKSSIALDSYTDTSRSRQVFEKYVESCHPGLAVLYSCSIGEGAEESTSKGGHYSSSLLDVASDWASSYSTPSGSALTVSDAHERTAPLVRRRTGHSQNPTADFPRNLPHFPLAVKG